MNAYGKRRLTVAQQETVHKAVVSEFEKYKHAYEKKCNERISFLVFLALAKVTDEQFGFGEQRRARLIKSCMDEVNALSDYLVSNKCETANGNERYDTEYNLETLKRLAEQYHIAFDESMFDDDIEEDI